MKTYDQYSLSDYPELLLSSPISTNQGAGTISVVGMPAGLGQPIITGSPTSFYMAPTDKITTDKNPLFFVKGSAFECVVFFHNQPSSEVPIIADQTSPIGIFANQDGFILRLIFDNDTNDIPIEALINVKDWNRKYYIKVLFGIGSATLYVDDAVSVLDYPSDPASIPPGLQIGAGDISDWFLIDGIAIYNNSYTDKVNFVSDPDNGHKLYSAAYRGVVTEFDTRQEEWSLDVSSSQFSYSGTGLDLEYNFCMVQLPQSDLAISYISLKSTDERIMFQYSLDGGATWVNWKDMATIANPVGMQMVLRNFVDGRYQGDDPIEFSIHFSGVSDGSILYRSPANLILTGGCVYSPYVDDSVVNCRDGAFLNAGYYDGTWMVDTKTIEIVFRPEVAPVSGYLEIFQAADGYVRWGPGSHVINGYTAVLNGQSVSDTNNVRMGQWNHLVLMRSTLAATTFSINKNAPGQMSLMLLGSYPDQLNVSDAQVLYQVLYGGDIISLAEQYGVVNEAVYADTGTAYSLYSYNWAIVGSTVT